MDKQYTARFAERQILEALQRSRVVEVLGARQVGKSSLVKHVSETLGGKYVTFDNSNDRSFANNDPKSFLAQASGKLLVIDEVQLVPNLIPEIKIAVDNNNNRGQFLLTGSANLLELGSIHESLAGRAEIIDMFGFSQDEIVGQQSQFIRHAFEGTIPIDWSSDLLQSEYQNMAQKGSYPEIVLGPQDNYSRWHSNYVRLITNRDAKDISDLRRLEELPKILKYIASIAGSELVLNNVSRDLGIARSTLDPYVNLLETLFLITRLKPWSRNLTSQVVGNKKSFIIDAGLANYLSGKRDNMGGIFETFIIGEIQKQISYQDDDYEMFYFRDYDKREVDLIVENFDGDIIAFEIKYSSTSQYDHAKILRKLKEKYGASMKGGFVVYTGNEVKALGDSIYAIPANMIWSAFQGDRTMQN
jgi:predicted AAA+ superfamily ATPase